VLGCGRWGTFHAWYAYRVGHEVTLWGRTGSEHLAELRAARRNEFLTLPEEIRLTDDLTEAIRTAEIVIISIHAQAFRSFLRGLCEHGQAGELAYRRVILCMKGLEIGTGKRLTTIVREELGPAIKPVVWVGPGHVQDFVRGIPNCMVLAGENAIARVRELHGATNPANAAEGTIRKRFAKDGSENAVHASDSPESAAREIHIFFSETEIF